MARPLRILSVVCGALLLLVAGAALRPLVLPESHNPPRVLNDTEIGFAQDMTAHHQQAIQMVQRLDPGVDPAVRQLADQIQQTQQVEIGTMLGWLRLANAVPMSRQPMAWMDHGGDTHASEGVAAHDHSATPMPMPGLATPAELAALSTARGRDAEILFLQLMYRHHLGGVTMARAADRQLPSGPVKETARGMIVAQSQECGLMALMLNQRGAQPLP